MATTFSRTLRSLEADRSRRWVVELTGITIVGAWLAWSLLARVCVYEVTEKARLETEQAVHTIAARVAGRVLRTHLAIGRMVQAGEVLVELDAEAEQRARQEKEARVAALAARIEALRGEIGAEEEALSVLRKARAAALAEARSQRAEAEARARFAARQADRAAQLRSSGAISQEEFDHQRLQAETSRTGVETLRQAGERLEQDRAAQESSRRAGLARLRREAVELAGEVQIEEAAIRRLDHAIDTRVIRAPIAGRIGSVAEFRTGSVVQEAEALGTIVPPGAPRVVALFPASAIGRLQPGQAAQVRLDGFPWTQYGTLKAAVADVGTEASGGCIRVELRLAPDQDSPVRLEHGLPGSAEVVVEEVSPAVMVLRAAGQLMASRRNPPQSTATLARVR
jgi:membrane fusion protein (multidrug efflux system)